MATERAHLYQAQHNERFLTIFDLTNTPYLDWAVTVIFYAALHYIRALAAKHYFTNISRYGDLDRVFHRVTVFQQNPNIYTDYRQLKDDSRAARYDMRVFSPQEVTDLREEELQRIRQFVLAHL